MKHGNNSLPRPHFPLNLVPVTHFLADQPNYTLQFIVTVIIFDNKGIGQTSAGTIKSFSISQYANDTAGLLDALQIGSPVDVLGHSLGSFIAQELTLMHPDKVNKLILFASNCGGKDLYQELLKLMSTSQNWRILI